MDGRALSAKQCPWCVVVVGRTEEDLMTPVTLVPTPRMQVQKQIMADICIQIAEHHRDNDMAKAVTHYREAINHVLTCETAHIDLAKLFLDNGDVQSAQKQLNTMLGHVPHHTEATVMLADIMFLRGAHTDAVDRYEQLLDTVPEHYQALTRLMDVNRRAGNPMSKVKPYLDRAEKACARSETEPGLNFSRGLYKLYAGDVTEALKSFNRARRDTEWGQRALCAMLDIFLNRTGDIDGGEIESATELQTVEALLKELGDTAGQKSVTFLQYEAYAEFAQKNKAKVGGIAGACVHGVDRVCSRLCDGG
eukprot:m.1260282 g.1260282  ORF g.1260282 m.1260282 type:complete len:307 (+) comp24726_c0_seq12:252-1172(+)